MARPLVSHSDTAGQEPKLISQHAAIIVASNNPLEESSQCRVPAACPINPAAELQR